MSYARNSRLLGLSLAMTVAASGVGCAALLQDSPPVAQRLTVEAPGPTRDDSFSLVPFQGPEPTAPALLERRLAALAQAVERRGAKRPARAFDVAGLGTAIGEVLEPVAATAQVSVHVRDLQTDRILFDYFGDTPLNPASNQKLLTSSAALDLLGSDYLFTTRVLRRDNELVLVGEGDPTLDLSDLHAIAELVAGQVSTSEIERLVVDDSAFSNRAFGPGYHPEGLGLAYQAPSGALSVNFNTVVVSVGTIRGQASPHVEVFPQSAAIEIDNRARVGRRHDLQVRTLAGKDGKTVVELTGSMRRRARPLTLRRRVVDPGTFVGHTFAAILAERTTTEPVPVVKGSAARTDDELVVNESPPLIEVVDDGLAYSNNFMAEQILRTLAWRMTGDPGDWTSGREILRDYWLAVGGDPDELVVVNASGLTAQGRVTTTGLVDLMSLAHRHALDEGVSLLDALPVAGEPGTLRSRLRLSGKRVRAKTGTMRGVGGLTGVVTSEDGTPQIAFSILTNVKPEGTLYAKSRRRIEDKIVLEVLAHLDAYEADKAGLTG